MDAKEIGVAIKRARVLKGETQVTMGARIGASQQIISGFERGRRSVPARYRKTITKVYGVKFEPDPAPMALPPERRVSTDRRRVEKIESPLPPVDRVFIEEFRNVCEGFAGVLVSMVRGRRRSGKRMRV